MRDRRRGRDDKSDYGGEKWRGFSGDMPRVEWHVADQWRVGGH
jgi:hypothetical protein